MSSQPTTDAVRRKPAFIRTPVYIRWIAGLPLAILSPILVLIAALTFAVADLFSLLRRKKVLSPETLPNPRGASIVIPNWNGRDLLEKYLPSVVAAADAVPGSEVIVVDNGSEDGSAEFLRKHFPAVRVLALEKNLGFGGGSNAGFRTAKNDIVVLLNSDMRVEPDFLAPLLAGFDDPQVFSVSCQIFLSDPNKRREETGLTEGWWEHGGLRVGHRTDAEIRQPFPCFYGGGGSSAYHRGKFLELGGFDELLAPFYLEDTDLGYMAWKRGWKNFYQPASVVYHEHRGTIGKKFSDAYIQGVLKKNYLLFTWKNIHSWSMLGPHLLLAWASALYSWLFGNSPERSTLAGLARATLQLPGAVRSRARARSLSRIPDREAFRRSMGGYFQDAFYRPRPLNDNGTEPLRVLFVSPYPISPPVHGGGVFMHQTVEQLAPRVQLHLIVILETALEREAHADLDRICASTAYVVRPPFQRRPASLEPHSIQEFRSRDLLWLIQREIFLHHIDVLQFEYTMLAQYGDHFQNLLSVLFEHDVYFQSIARRLPRMGGLSSKIHAAWEYLRALRWELRALPRFDRIQVCSQDNARYLASFLPQLMPRLDPLYRAGVNTAHYIFKSDGREPLTLLFLGSFRHTPNQEALEWFIRNCLPLILAGEPSARVIVIGSEPPARHPLSGTPGVEFAGFIEDVRDALARYAVFICPILSGSGVRVKLLEAFAAGIPVVSTRVGAEGLAETDGEICALADQPEDFARHVIALLRDPAKAQALAARARQYVESQRDIRAMTENLVDCYRNELTRKATSRRRPS